MATEGELTAEPVEDGEWVLFWTVAIVVLYFMCILAVTGLGAVLL